MKLLYKIPPSKTISWSSILEPDKEGNLSKRKATNEDVIMEDAETDGRKIKRVDVGYNEAVELVASIGDSPPGEQQ